MRAGLVGFVERGFVVAVAGFVVEEEEGFAEGPDDVVVVVGRGATDERLVGAGDGGGSGRFTSEGDAETPLPTTISTSDSSTILLITSQTRI